MHRLTVNVTTGEQSEIGLTAEELAARQAALVALAAKQYQRDRAQAYPSIVDQLDALYHGGYDGWRQQIQTVKEKYPKGQP